MAMGPHGCQPKHMGVGPGLRTRFCLLVGNLFLANAEAILLVGPGPPLVQTFPAPRFVSILYSLHEAAPPRPMSEAWVER